MKVQLLISAMHANPKELIEKIRSSEEVSKKITIIVERKNMIYKLNLDNIQ